MSYPDPSDSSSSTPLLRSLLDTLHVGCCELDHQDAVLFVNRQALQWLGLSETDLLGKNLWSVVPGLLNKPGYECITTPTQWGSLIEFREIDNTRKAEMEIVQHAEDKYRAIFNSIEEGFSLLDIQFDENGNAYDIVIQDANPAQDRIDGIRALIGKRVREILPNIEMKWIERYAAIARSGEPASFEDWSEANKRWYEVHASRVGGEGSTLVAIVYNDITERRRRQQHQAFLSEISRDLGALTGIAETMESLGEKIGRFFGVKWCVFSELSNDKDTFRVSGWNDADVPPPLSGTHLVRDFLSDEQAAKSKAGELTIVNDALADSRTIAATYAALQVRSFILVPLARNGQWQFQLSISDNKVRQWSTDEVELLKEITSRIWTRLEIARAEEALRQSQAQLEAIFEASPVGIAFVDTAGKLILQNKEMRHYIPTGIAPSMDDVNFDRWIAYYPDGARVPRQDYPAARALRGEKVVPGMEMFFRQEDGTGIWTQVAAIPIHNDTGAIIGTVGVITDISQLKQAAEALRESEEKLKNLLKEREEFIANASHELKTPLTSIRAYAELLEEHIEQVAEEPYKGMMHKLGLQVDRLHVLVADMLDTTRMSEGKLVLNVTRFDLNELIREKAEELQRITKTHTIRTLLASFPEIEADRERIGQVIVNLVSNAIKYSPKGGEILLASEPEDGFVKVSVSDQGMGIPAADLDKIFDRFFRVDSKEVRTFPGMGIGLFISQGIIQRHGGALTVKSEEGEGSTFTFTLPVTG
jgi:PAS domain S-box-containing protein